MPSLEVAGALNGARAVASLPSPQNIGVEPNASAVVVARRLYALRRSRGEAFGENLFGEPAWDMLLDLFISLAERRHISVSSLAIGSGGSSTTALRYLGLMEDRGLVLRIPDKADGRRTHIRLTEAGTSALSRILLSLPF